MPGKLNDALTEPISKENAEIVESLIKRKVTTAARIAVKLLHAMENRFGPEARDVLWEMTEKVPVESRPDPRDPEEDLHAFCALQDAACIGSHQWERVEEAPDRIAYQFSRCLWAEVFNELSEPDLGFLLCSGDEPAVKAFNPALGFARTKVLMHGAGICDHVYFVEEGLG